MTNREWLINRLSKMIDEEFASIIPNFETFICLKINSCPNRRVSCKQCKTNQLKRDHIEKSEEINNND